MYLQIYKCIHLYTHPAFFILPSDHAVQILKYYCDRPAVRHVNLSDEKVICGSKQNGEARPVGASRLSAIDQLTVKCKHRVLVLSSSVTPCTPDVWVSKVTYTSQPRPISCKRLEFPVSSPHEYGGAQSMLVIEEMSVE